MPLVEKTLTLAAGATSDNILKIQIMNLLTETWD